MLALLTFFRTNRQLLTLLAVLAAAASIYVWWQAAERDRASLIAAGDNICEAAGSPFRPAGVKHRDWGVACLIKVRALRGEHDAVKTANLDALLDDLAAREGKETVDAALAARMSKQAADAVARMEAADAAVTGDRATGAWAGSVNDAAGLR